MQRNVSASFGLASLPVCSFALKIEKQSSQVKISYNISSASSLEILLPYRVLLLILSNKPAGEMHTMQNVKLKASWSEESESTQNSPWHLSWANFIPSASRYPNSAWSLVTPGSRNQRISIVSLNCLDTITYCQGYVVFWAEAIENFILKKPLRPHT